jgi:hypothetical protein
MFHIRLYAMRLLTESVPFRPMVGVHVARYSRFRANQNRILDFCHQVLIRVLTIYSQIFRAKGNIGFGIYIYCYLLISSGREQSCDVITRNQVWRILDS